MFLFDLLGDVDHRAADPALAELGGREEEHDRFLADDVGVVDLVLRVRRDPGRDLGHVAADVGGGGGVDQRRLLADLRDLIVRADFDARKQRPGQLAPFPDQRRDLPLAVGGEVEVADVDGRRRTGLAAGRLRAEGRLGRDAFDPRREGTFGRGVEGFCALIALWRLGEVEGDFGVGRLISVGAEDAERNAVRALVEDRRGGGDDQLRGGRVFQHFGQRVAFGLWEVGLGRRRLAGRVARGARPATRAAAGEDQRSREQEEQRAAEAHRRESTRQPASLPS